ncbi:hypothetical protein [Bartonella sp. AA83SXKL]|uniref:hypothetical protein n=1 Tax=Bartonella sp. AA83SXKL TaxID=3243439 RepID=UPI0035D122A2
MYNISVISMGNFTGSTVRILSSAYPQIANISKQQRWRRDIGYVLGKVAKMAKKFSKKYQK